MSVCMTPKYRENSTNLVLTKLSLTELKKIRINPSSYRVNKAPNLTDKCHYFTQANR